MNATGKREGKKRHSNITSVPSGSLYEAKAFLLPACGSEVNSGESFILRSGSAAERKANASGPAFWLSDRSHHVLRCPGHLAQRINQRTPSAPAPESEWQRTVVRYSLRRTVGALFHNVILPRGKSSRQGLYVKTNIASFNLLSSAQLLPQSAISHLPIGEKATQKFLIHYPFICLLLPSRFFICSFIESFRTFLLHHQQFQTVQSSSGSIES